MAARSEPRPHAKAPGLRAGAAPSGFRINGRVWIERGGETVLGRGRLTLLERIRETGSLSKAARSMGMGYRHAWLLVDSMNRLSPRPLVRKATGGRDGGGSALTPEGEAALAGFLSLAEEFRAWVAARERETWPRRRDAAPRREGGRKEEKGKSKMGNRE
ncbi:MAG: LysR family transcriptional regulator [Planctomycetes bacterium]|jgi:molybdate transport system regulatory protein|nr:LysR family transcriptional regulator [Planctomycetota bacterium]